MLHFKIESDITVDRDIVYYSSHCNNIVIRYRHLITLTTCSYIKVTHYWWEILVSIVLSVSYVNVHNYRGIFNICVTIHLLYISKNGYEMVQKCLHCIRRWLWLHLYTYIWCVHINREDSTTVGSNCSYLFTVITEL